MTLDAVKAAVLVTLVAIVQVAFVNVFELVEGRADVLLLVVVSVALLRGPLFGACAGFWTGLVVDTMTLGTLGLTSLLLTLAGYAAGRFGEATSSRGSQRARVLIAVTIVVHVLLGEPASLGRVLVQVILPSLALNVVLAVPAFWATRRLLPPPAKAEREIALV